MAHADDPDGYTLRLKAWPQPKRLRGTLAVAGVVLIAASACSTSANTGTQRPTTPTPGTPAPVNAPDYLQWPGTSQPLAEYCPSEAAGTFSIRTPTVTAAFVCTQEAGTDEANGPIRHVAVHQVESGLDRLLREYRVPDHPSTPGAGCPADLPNPGLVWLHTSTGVTTARAPTDGCAHPLEAAASAFQALTLTLVAEETVEVDATNLR